MEKIKSITITVEEKNEVKNFTETVRFIIKLYKLALIQNLAIMIIHCENSHNKQKQSKILFPIKFLFKSFT